MSKATDWKEDERKLKKLRLKAERQDNAVILRFPEPPLAKSACSLLDLPTVPTGPVDSAMTFRREDLYGDDNR